MISKLQTALQVVYPPRCVNCGGMVHSDFGLCGACWKDTPFIGGTVCDLCGTTLPGHHDGDREICDDCMRIARPWGKGRAALKYEGTARKLVLALKHGDRLDVARPAARWMASVAGPIVRDDMIVAPVPLHWRRMLTRRYNQAALLAREVAGFLNLPYCPDLLVRRYPTKRTEGMGLEERFSEMARSMQPHPKRRHQLADRSVLLIDDVMTTGATFSAATEACRVGGATEVGVLALARVAKDA